MPTSNPQLFKARPGDWTWVMYRVMSIRNGVVSRIANNTYDFCRAVLTLRDVGLLTATIGKHSGLAMASHSWTPLAYLPAKPAPELDYEDVLALHRIASGTI
jgi:hypothetical protein